MDGGKVTVYTDGACSGNPGPGGWGAVLLFDYGEEHRISGGCRETTNNRMELTAVIEAFGALSGRCNVCVNTDSIYVKNGITSWIHTWKSNGWRTSSKSAVKNVDLWMQLEELASRHSVEWKWVKGHSGDKYNEEADVLARREVERQLALL